MNPYRYDSRGFHFEHGLNAAGLTIAGRVGLRRPAGRIDPELPMASDR